MTASETPAPPAGPVLLTRGRFALTEMPNGSWVIRHARPLCASCEACGCGEQQPEITAPALLVGLVKAHDEGQRITAGQLRRLMGMALRGITGPGEQEGDGDG